jgi:hypothetical protein
MRRTVPVAVNEHTSITDGITAQYFEFGDLSVIALLLLVALRHE